MGTGNRTFWRAASRAIIALVMASTLSSCIVMTHGRRREHWYRDGRTYNERRHDDHWVRRTGASESMSVAPR